MAISSGSDLKGGNVFLQNEYRLGVLERVVDLMIQRFPIIGSPVSRTEMDQIRRDVVKELQQKYPNVQIKLEEL